MLDKVIFLIALSGTAVVYADVLTREGMLFAPVQRWLRTAWRSKMERKATVEAFDTPGLTVEEQREIFQDYQSENRYEIDSRWWWKPLWGCYKCVAGQWGFWGYLIRYHHVYSWRTIPEHLAFTAFTILAAIIISKWSQD